MVKIPSQVESRKISITVDIVIFTIRDDDLQVLLVKRKYPPFKGMWVIPGGFVQENEDLEKAALRELEEETGVKDVYLEQLYTFGEPKRDPRGHVVTISYMALIDSETVRLRATMDAEKAAWYSIYKLPELGFDHKKILDYSLQRLRYKLEYTTVGFQLLPKKFTLSGLQSAYEIILNKKLDKRNFRKKILSLGLLQATAETKMEGAHRPAKLYRFKKKEFVFPKGVI